ncbi:hypothetical protein AMATHDRAFT_62533 [Amanita thiersii Skay4041]|uniref:ML-like domain-containing protein n=1 Tax=Amanita thiersii Skay4041 TaxID=703135 RepID=A0A2A9NPU6_9AGAR|nr:hypothetical protein AMATHDRAFT_62533 [Amanita thiersii Skay4041]
MLLSLLARLRAFLLFLLLLAGPAFSRDEVIFASSVTYCDPPETLLIQQFEVTYFARNQSVTFNISAASVQPNVNVTANLFLNVYGLNPVNYTIDLCNILGGALCPLPMYNFTGADSISLPDSLGVAGRIPGIAYKIPDLEGFAQLTLTEMGTGKIKACVQATLSNGWSTHQPSVEWVTGGFAIGALVSALSQSWSPTAIAPLVLLDLLFLYQTIASSAFLNLNYPSAYRSYTLNFAWATGLLSSTTIQTSIDRMRHLTGGKLADSSSGSAIGLVNRKLSPYNVPNIKLATLPLSLPSIAPVTRLVTGLFKSFSGTSSFTPKLHVNLGSNVDNYGNVQTVTANSANVLQAGIPIYVNSIHIATANAFMTVFLVLLVLVAILLSVFALIYLVALVLDRIDSKNSHLWRRIRHDYPCFVKAWTLRLGLVFLMPITIFVLYQWTLRDSWLSILLSVFCLLFILGLVGYPVFSTIRFACKSSPKSLYSHRKFVASYGPLYSRYRDTRYWFFLPFLTASVLKSFFIAFANARGEVQIVAILIIDSLLLLALVFFRPFETRADNIFSIFFGIVRLVCSGLLVAFIENLRVNAIRRVIIGIVIAVIFSVAVVVMFFRVIIALPFIVLRQRNRQSSSMSPSKSGDSDSAMLEKDGNKSIASWDPEQAITRPVNPTPDHSPEVDRAILQPCSFSPTTTSPISTNPSIYSRDSGTITVGSVLPRRWSFSLSAPGSPSTSSGQPQSVLRTMSEFSSTPHTPVTPISSVAHGSEGQPPSHVSHHPSLESNT